MAKRVVAIDDSEIALTVVQTSLEPYGVEVVATDTPGSFFREVFGGNRPDLILTDLEMPTITGSDICRQLKNDPRTQGIPLVILSTLPPLKLAPTARLLGADAYLCKAQFEEGPVRQVLLPLLGIDPASEPTA